MMERLVSLDSLLTLPFLPFSSHPMPLTKRFVSQNSVLLRPVFCSIPSYNIIIAKTTRH